MDYLIGFIIKSTKILLIWLLVFLLIMRNFSVKPKHAH